MSDAETAAYRAWLRDAEAQAEAILARRTEAARRRAIFDLLESRMEIGPPARQLIAEYFRQGRPKKPKENARAAVLAFLAAGDDKLNGAKRAAAIRRHCEQFDCSRADWRWYHDWYIKPTILPDGTRRHKVLYHMLRIWRPPD